MPRKKPPKSTSPLDDEALDHSAAREVLSTTGVARLLMVSESTVYTLIKSGGLPAYRVGTAFRSARAYRYHRGQVMDWLKEKASGAALERAETAAPKKKKKKKAPPRR